MAQDFYAAFGLGDSDKYIGTVDTDGVALVAIQGLHDLVKERESQIDLLRGENERQQQRIGRLEARLSTLEAAVRALTKKAMPKTTAAK